MSEKQLCTVFFSISKLLEDKTRKELEPHGIFQGQGKVLGELSKKDGMTQIEIAKSLDISPATVTNMVKRMESGKLVKRISDKHDERMMRVRLTKEGVKASEKVSAAWNKIDRQLHSVLNKDESEQLERILNKLQTALSEGSYTDLLEHALVD